MTITNPYVSHPLVDLRSPYMWAGDYLTYRGKIIGWVEHIPNTPPNLTSWIAWRLIQNNDFVTLETPWRHSTDHNKSGAMRDLEQWLDGMILRKMDVLVAFTKA